MTQATDVATRSSVSVSLTLDTLERLQEFCGVLAKTNLVPKAYQDKPGDILVAMLHGQEVGLPHLQALQSIAVVNGIPSIYGDAALAMVRASGKLEDFDEWIEVDGERQLGSFPILKWAEEGKNIIAYCKSKRAGMSRERITTYSVDDAERAKLWLKKGQNGFETPWCTVPARMLMWRARGWNLRDQFGDVLKGLAIYEEAMDIDMSKGADGKFRQEPDIEQEANRAKLAEGQERLRQHRLRQLQEKTRDLEAPNRSEQSHLKPDEQQATQGLTLSQINAVLKNPESVKEIAEVMNAALHLDLTPDQRVEITSLKDEAMARLRKKK